MNYEVIGNYLINLDDVAYMEKFYPSNPDLECVLYIYFKSKNDYELSITMSEVEIDKIFKKLSTRLVYINDNNPINNWRYL